MAGSIEAAPPARPSGTLAMTLEGQDERLSAALLAVAVAPRAETYRQLAREYRRLGVMDKAHEHFSDAVRLDPSDAVSYDALARAMGRPSSEAARKLTERAVRKLAALMQADGG